jgi:hypothetical protein
MSVRQSPARSRTHELTTGRSEQLFQLPMIERDDTIIDHNKTEDICVNSRPNAEENETVSRRNKPFFSDVNLILAIYTEHQCSWRTSKREVKLRWNYRPFERENIRSRPIECHRACHQSIGMWRFQILHLAGEAMRLMNFHYSF